ncbi:uncharacterized protein [Haliotis asinina]|uniref:uncharacterized protein n=1 Tax=Haliotis asinina TaxID=109174 RepID=UPI003531C1C6
MNQRTVSPSQHSEDSDASKTNQQKESIEGLADRSPSGWAVVAELEGDDIASGSEEERRFEKAENKALRKRRASSFRTRGRPNYVAPSATVSSASMVDTSRETTSQSQPFRSMVKRGPAPNQQCYFCGGFGHWRVACPAAASLRAAQSASSDSVQSNQDAVVKK